MRKQTQAALNNAFGQPNITEGLPPDTLKYQEALEQELARIEHQTKVAHHLVMTQACPPQWALDIVGPRPGWRHPAYAHFH